MTRKIFNVDWLLIGTLLCMLTIGIMLFISAALGLIARGEAGISSVVFNHLILGVGVGLLLLVTLACIDARYLRRYAPWLYGFGIFATLLVFIPGIGMMHGGGSRWIILGPVSFQPSELMKITTLIMTASYFAFIRSDVDDLYRGAGGYLALIALPALILIAQPDIGTLGVVVFSTLSIYFASGASLKHLASIALVGILGFALLAFMRPYVRDRIETFINPSQGIRAESYQVRQSLIAIGSGQLMGRGLGQGIQKFTYLPEPMGDSIFAVAGEEFGFIGSLVIVCLFVFFCLRTYVMSLRVSDQFSSLLAIGLASYLTVEALINISAMTGLAPLTGIPLPFMSQGGSAIMISLMSVGIILAILRKAPQH